MTELLELLDKYFKATIKEKKLQQAMTNRLYTDVKTQSLSKKQSISANT